MIAILVNFWREAQEPPLSSISKDTIKRFEARGKVVVRNKRQTVKGGNTDVNSLWVHARSA